MNPMFLPGNQFEHFYLGGSSIAAFRGLEAVPARMPEDWVGSTTTRFGEDRLGLSTLPDGRRLVDAVSADPIGWLGADHHRVFGSSTELLVKLLDAGQRLLVHCHPDQGFAREHLGCAHGKTEAWIVLDTPGPDPVVYLGFQEEVTHDELEGWVRRQDTARLLASLNRVPVVPGDAILVPAGLPHAIGAGIFITELQEPTDFSILLEWAGFDIDGARDGHLGLGFPLALTAADRSACGTDRLAGLRGPMDSGAARQLVLPAAADAFFRAERLRSGAQCESSFAILIVIEGLGHLDVGNESIPIRRGDTLVVPHAAGPSSIRGAVTVLRCLPPAATESPRLGAD